MIKDLDNTCTEEAPPSYLENEQLKQIIKLLGAEVKSARELAHKQEQEKNELLKRFDQREAGFFQECQRLKNELSLLEEKSSQLLSQKELQNELMEQKYASYTTLLVENAEIKQTVELLQRELKETSSKITTVPPQDRTKDQSTQQLARLAMELSKTQEEVHGLSCERAALIRAHKETEQEMNALKEINDSLRSQVASHEQEGSSFKQEKESLQKERETLEQKLTALESTLKNEKECHSLLTQEYTLTKAHLEKEKAEKVALETKYEALCVESKTKTEELETKGRHIQSLEDEIARCREEIKESEKRLKETEELLVVKIEAINEYEEVNEELKRTLQSVEEAHTLLGKEKEELTSKLQAEKKALESMTERVELLSKESETLRQKYSLTTNQVFYLEGWKKRADQTLKQMRTSLEGFTEYEKHVEGESVLQKHQISFTDFHLFNQATKEHGSLF